MVTEKPQESYAVSSASPHSAKRERDATNTSAYVKLYMFFGFNRGYNFPLCKSDGDVLFAFGDLLTIF